MRLTSGELPDGGTREGLRSDAVRDRNRSVVFTAVLTRGPLSRVELARLTGLSQATITKSVRPMLEQGYLLEDESAVSGPGRPVTPLRVNPTRHYVVGIKLAPDHVFGAVVDLAGNVLTSRRAALSRPTPASVVTTIGRVVERLLASDSAYSDRCFGVGIGVGGHVDPDTGNVRQSPPMGWADVELQALVSARTGLPCRVSNDVNALTLAEQWFGAGRDVPWLAVVTVGVGIGCGLVLGGELALGANGAAGELGHIVVDSAGERCGCGLRGCLETVASDHAILDRIEAVDGRRPEDVASAAARARAGDEGARDAFTRAGQALGQALATLANVVNPSRIVLSGEGIVASDLLLSGLMETFEEHTFSIAAASCELVARPLPDDTWARGAAVAMLHDLFVAPVGASSSPAVG